QTAACGRDVTRRARVIARELELRIRVGHTAKHHEDDERQPHRHAPAVQSLGHVSTTVPKFQSELQLTTCLLKQALPALSFGLHWAPSAGDSYVMLTQLPVVAPFAYWQVSSVDGHACVALHGVMSSRTLVLPVIQRSSR